MKSMNVFQNLTNNLFGQNSKLGKMRNPGGGGGKNPSSRKLVMETLEDRQLLSVNAGEYQQLQTNFPELELPAAQSVDNTNDEVAQTAANLQQAIIQAAQTDDVNISVQGSEITPAMVEVNDLIGMDQLKNDPRFALATGTGYTTVIIDSGIDNSSGYFNDAAGNSRIVYQYDFVEGDDIANDEHGHGTNVAGIAAGYNPNPDNPNGPNARQFDGIAPDAKIIALKVGDTKGIIDGWQIKSLKKVVQILGDDEFQKENNITNIKSVNISIGGGNYNWDDIKNYRDTIDIQGLVQTITDDYGVAVCVASGNEYYAVKSKQGLALPAVIPEVISVGAVYDSNVGVVTDKDGNIIDKETEANQVCGFTQRSADLTIMAPGYLSTTAVNNTMGGTSQASPVIAGTVVLAQQLANEYLGRSLTVDQIKDLLRETGDTITDNKQDKTNATVSGLSFQRVNVYKLAEAIYNMATPVTDALDAPAISTISTTADSITLKWGEVTNAVGYSVQYKQSSATEYIEYISKTTATSVTITGLQSNTKYDVRVVALGGVNYSDSTPTVVTVQTPNIIQLVAPQIATASTGANTVNIAWNAVDNAVGYTVEWSTTPNFSANVQERSFLNPGGNITATVSGLSEFTQYYFRVKATGNGETVFCSDWSNISTSTTWLSKPEKASTVVTTNLDVVNKYDGFISLREAIAYAGTNWLGNKVTFNSSLQNQTITLNGTELVINRKHVEIDASALWNQDTENAGMTIDARGLSRVFNVAKGASLTVNSMNLLRGAAQFSGGIIFNAGETKVVNCTLRNGAAYYGGAIYNSGRLNVVDCFLVGNRAVQGGAIFNATRAETTIVRSVGNGNQATLGGFLYNNNGTVEIKDDSILFRNESTQRGGALYNNGGTLKLDSVTMVGNVGTNFGGAIYNIGSLSVVNSNITRSSAIYGGAIANYNSMYIADTYIAYNTATLFGGGIYNSSGSNMLTIKNATINNNSAYDGGGVYVLRGTLKIYDSRFLINTAAHNGGGMYVCNQIILYNCTVSGNYARFYGGGIYNEKVIRIYDRTSVSKNATGTGLSVNLHNKKGSGQSFFSSELPENYLDDVLADYDDIDLDL